MLMEKVQYYKVSISIIKKAKSYNTIYFRFLMVLSNNLLD